MTDVSRKNSYRYTERLTEQVGVVLMQVPTNNENYPYDMPLEEVLVEHRKSYRNPRVRWVSDAIIKHGPRNSKVATIFQIINEHTGEIHHHAVKLQTLTRRKRTGWAFSDVKSITLGDSECDSREIGKLMTFIASVTKGLLPDEEGRYVIINSQNQAGSELLKLIHGVNKSRKLSFALDLLSELGSEHIDLEELETSLQSSDLPLLRKMSLAARIIDYRRSYEKLTRLVEDPSTTEAQIQRHLAENTWIFGSEYSEILGRRVWTRDDQLDFMLRRTADGYLEIIEIKTPIENALFNHDASHDSYYHSAKISQVIGQVTQYIDRIERERDSIIAQIHEDPLKIRAKIIIGRDGDEHSQAALRRLNSQLTSIEIMTFDQLLRVAKRVLSMFEDKRRDEPDSVGDLPF